MAEGDAGQQQGAEGAQEGQEGQQADPVLDRLNDFSERFGRIEEAIGLGEGEQGFDQNWQEPPFDPSSLSPEQQAAWAQQQQQGFDPYQGQQGQPQFDQYGQPVYGQQQPMVDQFGNPVQQQQPQIDPQQARTALSQMLGIDPDAVTRMGEQLERITVERAAEQIEQRWPELATPEGARSAIEAAQQVAQQMGQPHLAGDPAFVEQAWLAQRARDGAQAETPADANGVPLEQSGARGPGEPEQDEGDLIVAAAQGARPPWHGDGR